MCHQLPLENFQPVASNIAAPQVYLPLSLGAAHHICSTETVGSIESSVVKMKDAVDLICCPAADVWILSFVQTVKKKKLITATWTCGINNLTAKVSVPEFRDTGKKFPDIAKLLIGTKFC